MKIEITTIDDSDKQIEEFETIDNEGNAHFWVRLDDDKNKEEEHVCNEKDFCPACELKQEWEDTLEDYEVGDNEDEIDDALEKAGVKGTDRGHSTIETEENGAYGVKTTTQYNSVQRIYNVTEKQYEVLKDELLGNKNIDIEVVE